VYIVQLQNIKEIKKRLQKFFRSLDDTCYGQSAPFCLKKKIYAKALFSEVIVSTSFLPSGAVSAFWSGGWQIESEASRKFLPPPCRGVASFTGGCQQLIHKHINIGIYDLLIVIYHLL
jgi:hypothetical protein